MDDNSAVFARLFFGGIISWLHFFFAGLALFYLAHGVEFGFFRRFDLVSFGFFCL